MKIVNCNLIQDKFYSGLCDIEIEDGIVKSVTPIEKIRNVSEDGVTDAGGRYVMPGFVDTHIHGAFGSDTSDCSTEAIINMAKNLIKFGVTAFCPTTMTTSKEVIMGAFKAVSEAAKILENSGEEYAEILGVHLEGPFLSPVMSGVQSSDCLVVPSDVKAYEIMDEIEKKHPGMMKIVDIAPELDGAMEFISKYSDKYVISYAHSAADYDTSVRGFKNGANSVTHLLNAMNPSLKRAPGIPAAAFDCGSYVEMICDGFHIDEAVLRMNFKLYDDDKIIIVSDSMRGAGMPDGVYKLADTDVTVRGGRTYFGEGGNLAGSVTNMNEEVTRLIKFGVLPEKVFLASVVNPLKRLGIYENDRYYIHSGNKVLVNIIDI